MDELPPSLEKLLFNRFPGWVRRRPGRRTNKIKYRNDGRMEKHGHGRAWPPVSERQRQDKSLWLWITSAINQSDSQPIRTTRLSLPANMFMIMWDAQRGKKESGIQIWENVINLAPVCTKNLSFISFLFLPFLSLLKLVTCGSVFLTLWPACWETTSKNISRAVCSVEKKNSLRSGYIENRTRNLSLKTLLWGLPSVTNFSHLCVR